MKGRLADLALLAAIFTAVSIESASARVVVPGPLAGAGLPFVGLGLAGIYLYNRFRARRG